MQIFLENKNIEINIGNNERDKNVGKYENYNILFVYCF